MKSNFKEMVTRVNKLSDTPSNDEEQEANRGEESESIEKEDIDIKREREFRDSYIARWSYKIGQEEFL